jgi:ATPase subunit of ABC transporter with duplicated ATPase domains
VLTAQDISFGRGGQTVLDRVSLSVGPRTRLGVVGPNGIGKTTLLAILAGELPPDGGSVERAPASLTVGYLTQEPDAGPGEALIAYLARRTGVAGAAAQLDRLTAELEADSGALDAYGEALDRFLALGGDDFEARAQATCGDVGLAADRMRLPVADLSGGQAARARLAAVLLARFDVFLLDEPTNDLDFDGIDRLERFLASVPGAVVTVSHDRAFLDRCVTRILEIEEHTHRAAEYAGAWSEYVERRTLARTHAGAAYESWQSERRRLSDRIRSQRAWSEEGVRKATRKPKDNDKAQRGFRVNRTEKQASKVRISERALDRLGTVEKPWEGWQLQLDLAPTSRSGDLVARLDAAVVRRGDFALGPVDLQIGWAERIVVMGPNGGGKSTLLAALLGRVALDGGTRWVGPSVRFGELDQQRGRLASGGTLVDAFTADTGVLAEEARSTLAKFGLTAEHVRREVRGLSPGERTRAQLAALMVTGTNCLVLDEPTNHLDLPAIEQLEAALESFTGTLLLVTHDRWLLETVRHARTIEVAGGVVAEREAPVDGAPAPVRRPAP